MVGPEWRWRTWWICWAVHANLQCSSLSAKPSIKCWLQRAGRFHALWEGTRRLLPPWAFHYFSSWSRLALLNVVIKNFQTSAGVAVGVCQNCLFSPDRFCLCFCMYFPCMPRGIKSWLETYSFYAWITLIFSARGSSFFSTALLLVCWDSLIACKSFSCPPKLIFFSMSSDFCLNMDSYRANLS